MKLKPLYTEKSMSEAKKGNYTFLVDPSMDKNQIKVLVNTAFGVHTVSVHTVNSKATKRRTMAGKIKHEKARKKAVIALRKGEKIDLFDEKDAKKGKNK